ncbi:hypothetical protein SISSUDRAFT_128932 [Sistotremastrum suecicum HHB10207 ss-3]|uniref:Uncharacterized protein n=1 Tax=Sistotremastrum suecicum HHB10207 ss-3 TaxID=1314776 RepID=A0A166AWQ1_9AGAM|nr:hypothetical protein SISSUDRAFT_128932 [Sistotremastrum suecicum HHB10207 ss-3]
MKIPETLEIPEYLGSPRDGVSTMHHIGGATDRPSPCSPIAVLSQHLKKLPGYRDTLSEKLESYKQQVLGYKEPRKNLANEGPVQRKPTQSNASEVENLSVFADAFALRPPLCFLWRRYRRTDGTVPYVLPSGTELDGSMQERGSSMLRTTFQPSMLNKMDPRDDYQRFSQPFEWRAFQRLLPITWRTYSSIFDSLSPTLSIPDLTRRPSILRALRYRGTGSPARSCLLQK